ncbi:MAG: hypothetical protein FWE40_07105 [Oscillospiraceae bacterium]|nr:hypothetical protein [Oscillospiraceae bacterium]
MHFNWSNCACMPCTPWECMHIGHCFGPCKPCAPCYGGPPRGQQPVWPPRPGPYYGGYGGGANFFIGDFTDFSEVEHLPQRNV